MKLWSVRIGLTAGLLLVCVHMTEGRFGQGGRQGVDARREPVKSDAEIFKEIEEELGPEASEEDILHKLHVKRELARLKEKDVKMKRDYERQQRIQKDPWKSGLYVKYMAYGLVLIVVAIAFAVGSDKNVSVVNKKDD